MLEGGLPSEYAEKWKWSAERIREQKHSALTERTFAGKDLEETDGWKGGAKHGLLAHTWGN